jgi:hypothetical protein
MYDQERCPFRKLGISRNLRRIRIRVVQIEVVGYQIRSINCGEGIITAENFGALIVLYSETGGHVLTPFLGTCPGWQDRVAVRCGLLVRMVADEGKVECD